MTIITLLRASLKRMRSNASVDPVRDWLILLSLSMILLISIIVWNVWAFDTVASGGTIGTSAGKTPEVFKQSSLEDIRTLFDNRAIEAAKYDTGVYKFIDPSL